MTPGSLVRRLATGGVILTMIAMTSCGSRPAAANDEPNFDGGVTLHPVADATTLLADVMAGCRDGVLDGSETAIDCGGPDCAPCRDGTLCNKNLDCAGGDCFGSPPRCATPSCFDGRRDGAESDVDCGGFCVVRCAAREVCRTNSDCLSRICDDGSCAEATCVDGILNQDESDIDCGGNCGPCPAGSSCASDSVCQSAVCRSGKCAPASCSDGIRNGAESDVDCGQICPDRCTLAGHCSEDDDCITGLCSSQTCIASCRDGIKDGDETDVDCGGITCGRRCGPEQSCARDVDCRSQTCDPGTQLCVTTCNDGVRSDSLGETDVDCGGSSCAACRGGRACALSRDCASGSCLAAVCVPARSCENGVADPGETGVDCGGSTCKACADGGACLLAGDCASGVCKLGACAAATCDDGVENRDEIDVDCGGGSCSPCPLGWFCSGGNDCASGVCMSGRCTPATCTDGARNGSESDVDCGASCSPCLDGLQCKGSSDCQSSVCSSFRCSTPTCSDGARNGSEIDVDCGATCKIGCPPMSRCATDSDCASLVCRGPGTATTCLAASCHDQVLNGLETDYDCGGPACPPCGPTRGCRVSADCLGGSCDPQKLTCDPTCNDGLLDGPEADLDCGGPCPPCRPDRDCGGPEDCTTQLCSFIGHGLHCRPVPTCSNGVKEDAETDLDCGGPLCSVCASGKACTSSADCLFGCDSTGHCS